MSPLTFEDWNKPFLMRRASHFDDERPIKTFQDLVREACEDKYFFLRKVGVNLPAFSEKPWHCSKS